MAEFGELKSPLQGFPLSEHWRYSLEQNWVWLEYCRVLPVLKGGSVARWHELGLQPLRACRMEDDGATASFLMVCPFSPAIEPSVPHSVTHFVVKDYSAPGF